MLYQKTRIWNNVGLRVYKTFSSNKTEASIPCHHGMGMKNFFYAIMMDKKHCRQMQLGEEYILD